MTALTENVGCRTCGGVGHLGPATGSPQRDYGRACPECTPANVEPIIVGYVWRKGQPGHYQARRDGSDTPVGVGANPDQAMDDLLRVEAEVLP